ncbi:MAG: VWA domain-containing protein [Acidobacteriota bacterium]
MRPVIVVIAICGSLVAQRGAAQAPDSSAQSPILRRQTNVVIVPALVRTKTGALVYTLKADDFVLTDDGVPQKLTLDSDTGNEPLALVVLIETGGAANRQFQKYDGLVPPLAPMLQSVIGGEPARIAAVKFDSRPTLVQKFTPDLEEAEFSLRDLSTGCSRHDQFETCDEREAPHNQPAGDNGAAILDALEYAMAMLRVQPPQYRRAILLVSETADRGSTTTVDQAVRDLTDTNTTIYAIAYSTAKSEAGHYAYRQLPISKHPPRGSEQREWEDTAPNPPHGCMGKDPDPDPDAPASRWSQFYDCVAQLVPPLTFAKIAAIATTDSLKQNVPSTVARLTGGEYFTLGNERHLERDLATIGNHLPNRYFLSFQPQSPHPGLHMLTLKAPNYPGLGITARTSYWADKPSSLQSSPR